MPPGQWGKEVFEEEHQGSGSYAIGGCCWEEDQGALQEDREEEGVESGKLEGREVEVEDGWRCRSDRLI